MDIPNWVVLRLWVQYCDASFDCTASIACSRPDPEAELIAIEQRNLVLRLAKDRLQTSQALAIQAMLTGEAESQIAAAHAAGLTQIQLCRAIKRLAHIYAAYTA